MLVGTYTYQLAFDLIKNITSFEGIVANRSRAGMYIICFSSILGLIYTIIIWVLTPKPEAKDQIHIAKLVEPEETEESYHEPRQTSGILNWISCMFYD